MRIAAIFIAALAGLCLVSLLVPKYAAVWTIATGKINWLATVGLNAIYAGVIANIVRIETKPAKESL